MALAVRLDGLIRAGAVAGYAELARLGHVTRARVTQVMNLLHLAQGPLAMGHICLPPLPATRKWNQVVDLIGGGAVAAQLATATINAAERGLKAAANDHGVVETYWLLVRIPLAARAADFAVALRECDVSVPDDPGLLDVAVAFSAAVDARMPDGKNRTDLGEMAQTAGVETINAVVGPRSQTLFGSGPDEVRRAFASLGTPKQFGTFAHQFFTRFAFKCLTYFLGRALPRHLGGGRRFRTVAEQAKFTDAIRTHCREACVIVERFSGEWFSLHRFQTAGDISRGETQRFFGRAMTKLTKEFRKREGTNGT
jgi:hypothetical protein